MGDVENANDVQLREMKRHVDDGAHWVAVGAVEANPCVGAA